MSHYHEQYLESRVASASSLELVCILYRSAIDSIREAQSALAAGDILRRGRAVTKACEVLTELVQSLRPGPANSEDHIEGRLRRLYDYMLFRLTEANASQSAVPMAEVERLLLTLLEGWEATVETPSHRHEDVRESCFALQG